MMYKSGFIEAACAPKNLEVLSLQSPNLRVSKELEVIVNTSPENLSKFAVKEIPIKEARKLVEEIYGVSLDTKMDIDNARYWLENTKKLTPKESLEFYKKIINTKK